ncbi:MAG: serine hydrolase [Pseudomonadota bacterium]|nr:serine hydrolase [Pseudomonadota bacterium]
MRRVILWLLLLGLGAVVHAYPLDGYEYTGISRLEFYRLAALGEVKGRQLPPGALLSMQEVQPHGIGLPEDPGFLSDPDMVAEIKTMLGAEADRYAVALLDMSEPDNLVYAEHNAAIKVNVGSVGKMLVGLAIFQRLHDLYPDDIASRERILRNTQVVADGFIRSPSHKVVFWQPDTRTLKFRRLQEGDTASLWEYLDWMYSASSNAAAAMVMKQLIVMQHSAHAYPMPQDETDDFFESTSSVELGKLLDQAMTGALVKNGFDPDQIRQGSFFTREGKRRVVGKTSYATPRELLRLVYKLETGQLVDKWSSREMKRLLYMTQKRIRYASHPALKDAAVYFKSGSLYSCVPEAGFVCRKYMGNKRNQLASLAIVESPAKDSQYRYMVVVSSNVLRVNSAVAHQTLAMRIHRMIERRHQQR